jgi:hypothetical protein
MLTADELVAHAETRAGSSDFAGDSWRDGLEAILAALRHEANPSEAGTAAFETQATQFLVNRLEINRWYREHPEIDDQEIRAPIFSVGMVRTGTTALSFLLDEDPDNRSLLHWQAMFPCPPPETARLHDDPRITQAEAAMGITGMAGEDRKLIENLPDGPAECLYLLGMDFKSGHFEGMFNVPSYHDWLFAQDLTSAYEWHRRVLKLLQWRAPTKRWSLKYPSHMIDLDAMVRVYPEARIITTHRDPVRSITSVCSLVSSGASFFCAKPDPLYLGRQWSMIVEEQLRRFMDFGDRHGVDRFVDINHIELVEAPMETLERTYRELGIELTDAARAGFRGRIMSNPKGVHGVHHYEPSTYGLDVGALDEQFSSYRERFGVEREPFEGS